MCRAVDERPRRALGLRRRLGHDPHRRRDRLAAHARSRGGSADGRRGGMTREWTTETLVAGVLSGEPRALARAISLVGDGDPAAYGRVRALYPQTGRAPALGLTWPPR